MKILFIAPIDAFGLKDSGYGTAAGGIAYVLKKMKETGEIDEITFINLARFGEAKIPREMHDIAILVTNPNGLLGGPGCILHRLAPFLSMAKKRYLSVVWETTPLPSIWKDVWELHEFDGFLTPSHFVAEQLKKDTHKPVYYYPHYIHADEIPQVNITTKMEEDIFNVLFIGQHTKRKGMEDAVTAFTRALGYEEDARLILKYHTMTAREIDPIALIRHTVLCNTTRQRPKATIHSITQMLDRNQLCRLYSNSSVLLFPSRGEGFGLPPAEAMCAGIPVIYTNWSSLPEVCGNATGNLGVSYHLDEAQGMLHHGYMIQSKYAVPNISDLMNGLRATYSLWKKDRAKYYGNCSGNRDIIKKRFGYETVSECLKHIFTNGDGFCSDRVEKLW